MSCTGRLRLNIDFTGPLISADSAPSAALMAMAIFGSSLMIAWATPSVCQSTEKSAASEAE